LQDRGYTTTLIKFETLLTDLGIQGRVGRLTLLKSAKDLVDGASREGADTVVAVGNDITLSQVAQAVLKHPKITVGFVPLGTQHQTIAQLLGIPLGLLSCHVLSSRIVASLAIGKINNQYFLQSVSANGTPTLLCEGSYEVALDRPHEVRICNLDRAAETESAESSLPTNQLVACITPTPAKGFGLFRSARPRASLFPLQELRLSSSGDELPLMVDNYRVLKTPAVITLATQKLRMIVGKKRLL
ncbi:MAG: diacylglycerol kinase family protein, partial [Candidatus Veblenbacteria bacterium]|nr:diacylglycerol kinase family protein [Candidatus Veblenbacteria bacterium]